MLPGKIMFFASYHNERTLIIFIYLLVFLCVLSKNCYTQNENQDLLERISERYSEVSDKPVDFSEITEVTDHLKNHPINLNNTNHEELSQLGSLNDRQINNLLNYIQAYGTVYSIYELSVVDGFDSATIRKIIPYISVGQEKEKHTLKFKDLLSSGRSQLLVRAQQVIQHQTGYNVADSILKKNPNAGYLGSPLKLVFRYNYSFYDRISIGVSGDKDPGEQFFKGAQKNGMDFYSGFLSLQNTGFLKQLTIGNFSADFGQGLTLCSGISSGTIPGTGTIRRYERGIVPSQSTNEGNYLRGIAMVLKKWNFRLSLFFSDHKRDANITNLDTVSNETKEVSTFSETGYHRTPGEIADKNAIREIISGGNLNFRSSIFSIGLTGFHSHWSADLEPKTYPYNIFTFREHENLNAGINFQASLRNIFLFGEASGSRNGGMAFLSGIQLTPDPRLMLSISIRDYQRNYQDILSNALGQNSTNANEEGIMVSLNASLFAGLTLTGYADLYRYPWLKYRTDSPSQGSEYQVQSDYSTKFVKMFLRFRIQSKQINTTSDVDPVNLLTDESILSLRYQADWQVSESLKLRSRIEGLRNGYANSGAAYGYLLSQSLTYKLPVKHLFLSTLYAIFDTDSYNERIFAYESDVLYGYSVPSYYGDGIRCMFMIEWDPCKTFELALRYDQTWYSDRTIIGTGLDVINGSTKSGIEVQLQVKF